jgi:hypothetical protein
MKMFLTHWQVLRFRQSSGYADRVKKLLKFVAVATASAVGRDGRVRIVAESVRITGASRLVFGKPSLRVFGLPLTR